MNVLMERQAIRVLLVWNGQILTLEGCSGSLLESFCRRTPIGSELSAPCLRKNVF